MRISDWSADVCSSDRGRNDKRRVGHDQIEVKTLHGLEAIANTTLNVAQVVEQRVEVGERNRSRADVDGDHLLCVLYGQQGGIAAAGPEIGRASGRDRGCQYVKVSGGAGILKKQ